MDNSGKVDLSTQWSTFTSALGPIKPLMNLLAVIGMLIVAWAFVKWAWDRRRGGMSMGGGGGHGLSGALIVGLLLSAPGFVIPAGLEVFDVVINALVNIWKKTAGA